MNNKFILSDSASNLFDDLVIFENDIDINDIRLDIEELQKETDCDYTNEDVYKILDKYGKYTIIYIGCLEKVVY